MLTKTNFSLLLSFFFLSLTAQTKLTLQPNAANGKDSHVAMSSNGYDGGGGNAPTLFNSAWTQSGVPFTHRSMVEFDLSALPANAIIIDAKLSLYAYNQAETHSQQSGSNTCWIERITSNWDEGGVKWSNQPSSTTTNRVEIAGTSDGSKDYEINVTNLVQDMADDPANSFGFLLKLQNEVRYRMMTFCTSDHADPTKHPKLSITYQINTAQLNLRPDGAAGKDSHVAMSSNGYDGGGGNAPTLFNSAWTQSGVPFTHRSMVEFDLSALPANATIIDAKLSLYAYNQAETHSQQSGSNACWIERITSNWDEGGVKWSNQPSSTTTNRVEIAGTSDGSKDYEINVTNLVQDMADDPSNSFGFLLKLQNETRYRMMTFCTSDHADPTKHPSLELVYTTNNDITCVEETYILGGQSNGVYSAKNIITATGTVEIGEVATFIAPVIVLEPGFHAKVGSTLLIQTGENCGANSFTSTEDRETNRVSDNHPNLTLDSTTKEENLLIPITFDIAPNPFNNETFLTFSLQESTIGDLAVFSASGQLIQKLFVGRRLDAGKNTFVFKQRFNEKVLFYFVLKTDKTVIVKKAVSQ